MSLLGAGREAGFLLGAGPADGLVSSWLNLRPPMEINPPPVPLSPFFSPSCHPRLAFVVVLSGFFSGRVLFPPLVTYLAAAVFHIRMMAPAKFMPFDINAAGSSSRESSIQMCVCVSPSHL